MGRVPITNGLSTKLPVVQTPDYVIWLEPFLNRIWVHVDIFRWTPAVKRQYMRDFKAIQGPLYAANTSGNRLEKFILLHEGWRFHERRDFGNGTKYDVYRRS